MEYTYEMAMMIKGSLVNEFGEVEGRYWYREGMNAYCLRLYGKNRNGYTEKGICDLAERLGLYVVEDK